MNIVSIIGFVFLAGSLSANTGENREPRIINGELARILDFPYQVSLRSYGDHFCGGSIISEKHILTAAHCVVNETYPYHGLTVNSGTSFSTVEGYVHNVADIIVHPNYSDTVEQYRHDIAIIKLTRPIEFNQQQNKINLETRKLSVEGSPAVITGWGAVDKNDNGTTPLQLRKLNTFVYTVNTCKRFFRVNPWPETICTYLNTTTGICLGDSGGPLVAGNKQIGVASLGYGCAAGVGDVFTNVYDYGDFINSALSDQSNTESTTKPFRPSDPDPFLNSNIPSIDF